MKYINILTGALALSLSLASLNTTAAEAPAAKEKLVLQVSDADTGKWNLALSNARNVQQAYGADQVDTRSSRTVPG